MGEAKRRRKAQESEFRRLLLWELNVLSVPAWHGETETFAEVMALPIVAVPRAPLEAIDFMNMKPQECHLNATAYAHLDPSGRSHVVTGWLCETAVPRLHSVIDTGETLMCITPHDLEAFRFRPDPLAVLSPNGRQMRRGRRLGSVLRQDPDAVARAARECIEIIESGADLAEISEHQWRVSGLAQLPAG